MKQTLLFAHSFFTIATFMIACTSQMAVADNTIFSSDSCAAIDKKIMKLDRFTTMVNNTSAFHLAEKALVFPVPGITVSNNKKQMLRDAKKKYAEYAAERQKYDCETPMAVRTQVADKKAVISKPATSANIDKKIIKTDEFAPKINNTSAVNIEEKDVALEAKRQKYVAETPITTQTADKKAVVNKPVMSSDVSDSCAAINKKIMRLDEFITMVNNTSAFHWEEKAAVLLVPGITVSNNKKKMLRNAEKKGVELLKEQQKLGCKPQTEK